jgi:hypothetical protein
LQRDATLRPEALLLQRDATLRPEALFLQRMRFFDQPRDNQDAVLFMQPKRSDKIAALIANL